MAAILRHFWKEAWIRVPRSPSVYTHMGAGSNRVNEGESGGARECGFSTLHPCIPQHSHSYASTLLFFHGPLNSFSVSICSARTDQIFTSTNQWTVCSLWILLRQAVQEHKVSLLSVEQAVPEDDHKAQLSHSVLFLLPCLTLR